ncbi:uncharacterized protein LOC106637081 [Copidosoma floridanum]|uniref:uncharacterized protein LOC106637081 n=1 Tax=Copidosoma floridanum TaxID=29053 RepID=UPI0006C96DB4|nr:uncharacterized protein LOC106637081 [Copidosoma floridanum]
MYTYYVCYVKTRSCLNSINILRRQEKAAKLNTCFCDGAEDYDCTAIHRNMDELCFHRPPQHHKYREHEHQKSSILRPGDAATVSSASKASGSSDVNGDVNFGSGNAAQTNKTPESGAARATSWQLLLVGLVLLLQTPLLCQSTRGNQSFH